VYLHAFLLLAVDVGSQLHAPAIFALREGAPGTSWKGCQVGFRAGLSAVENRKFCYPCQNLKTGS
jgi:hypothetical protein